ncbi:hypothetical protein D6833_00030 [Candidatus Parcubacteria bacterium]|nr:MAG: hypothetical protein D6833_00030 [Candidatus Parcubacteria bacterium]
MRDVFTPYEIGLTNLLEQLGRNHPRYTEALTLQSRLLENIRRARRHGNPESHRAERAQIIDALNILTLDALAISFNELCESAPARAPTVPPAPKSEPPPAPHPTSGPSDEPERDATPHNLPSCPFVAGPMITDPRLFVGRKEQLGQIVSRWRAFPIFTTMGRWRPSSA